MKAIFTMTLAVITTRFDYLILNCIGMYVYIIYIYGIFKHPGNRSEDWTNRCLNAIEYAEIPSLALTRLKIG